MAFTLAEYKKESQDPLVASVYESFINNSPILARMGFESINGGAIQFNRETTLPTTAFRAIGSDYTASEGVITTVTENLKILGGKIKIDRALREMYGEGRLMTSMSMQLKSLARFANYNMVKGDGTGNSFTGWQSRIAAGQTVDNGTAALSLSSFDEAMAELEGENGAIFVGQQLWLLLTAALRDQTLSGNLFRANDNLGNPMMFYGRLPIVYVGRDASDAEILDFTETGTTTSAYFVSFDNNGVTGVQTGPIKNYTPVTESVASEFDVEWIMSYIIGNLRSAIRVSGITNATVVA